MYRTISTRAVTWGILGMFAVFCFLSSATRAQDPPATPGAEAATPAAAAQATEESPAAASAAESTSSEAPATEAPPAEEPAAASGPTTASLAVAADTLWVLVAGMLVFFMNLGFGCVESGFCRAKNCVNILSKNFIVFAVSTFGFWLLGWGLMFGTSDNESLQPYVGTKGVLMVSGEDNSPATGSSYVGDYPSINWTGVPLSAKFFFQLVFAGTAATIVSGAVAERIKYLSFIVFSLLISIFIYPVVGHWIWGGGWLASKGFFDFAGSTQVHSIGGWCALTGILFLGPRIGKYGADGKVFGIPGHNMTAAFIGCLVLWFGWFGFNPGSTMGISADPQFAADVALTTNLAAAMATLSATMTAWLLIGKPDIGMTLNGCLAGLVAITAPCAFVTPAVAAIIGLIAGVLVVLSVFMFDKLKIDDPVGATSVHLVNGVFGTLCIGLFADPSLISRGAGLKAGLFFGGGMEQLITQLIGVVATAVYVIIVSSICWATIKATMGLRVSAEEEREGLDIGEHGNEAYHGFVMALGHD